MKFKTQKLSINPYYRLHDYSCNDDPSHFSGEEVFDTYEDALKSAKEVAVKHEKNVEVWALKSTVKFPEPDLKVVEEPISENESN